MPVMATMAVLWAVRGSKLAGFAQHAGAVHREFDRLDDLCADLDDAPAQRAHTA